MKFLPGKGWLSTEKSGPSRSKDEKSPSCQDGSTVSNYSDDKDLGEEDEEEKRWIEQFRPLCGQWHRVFCV